MGRTGNFSSSEIYRLMSYGRGKKTIENTGKAFDSYVKEKIFERKIGRSLKTKINSKPTSWGTLVEEQAFNVLGLKYSLVSKDRFYHSEYKDYWSGMPDLLTDDLVGDIKCPFTLQSFMELINCVDDLELFKKSKPMYYWQLISNGILCDKDNAVLAVYVPYQKEIEDIKELAETKIDDANTFAWINWATDDEIPHLPNDCEVENIHLFEFEIPKEDKFLLTERVKLAVQKIKENE